LTLGFEKILIDQMYSKSGTKQTLSQPTQ